MPARPGRAYLAHLVVAAVAVAGIAAALLLPAIPQDPAYHEFADTRAWFGIGNFWNVVSNAPFVMVGLYGLGRLPRLQFPALRAAYVIFCLGTALVGVGSACYHLAPSTPTLAYDRLPMTVAFMALFAAVIQDRVSQRTGRALLGPLIVIGLGSIAYWTGTELAGRGDLRPYAVVQFLPTLLLPLLLVLYRGTGLRDAWLWAGLGGYVLAKLAEYLDAPVYAAGGFVSGHTLKHLLAALAALLFTAAFWRPRGAARAGGPTASRGA